MTQMPCLVLREGGEYTLQDLKAQLKAQESMYVEESNNLSQTCFEELANLKLSKASTAMSSRNGDSFGPADVEDEPGFESEDVSDGLRYLTRKTRRGSLVMSHLVGAANLPCGVALEVLPKIEMHVDDDLKDRAAFKRMWEYATDLNLREHDQTAGVDDAQLPLHEWLVRRFLDQVDSLVARGIRLHYVEREDNLSTVRGRLLVAQNMRTNAMAPQRFFCRFEEFSADRPENRLIRSAVRQVMVRSTDPGNQRRAGQLNERLQEIPLSKDIGQDFSRWRDDRLMAHYRDIRSSCKWILNSRGAAPVAGEDAMFGRFVRMNDVFERYVARWMQDKLAGTAFELLDQNSALGDRRRTEHLCHWDGKPRSMKPDILIYSRSDRDNCVAILDAKWKRTLDKEDGSERSSAGSDLYQMYAYAQHWLAGPSDTKFIALVYPADPSNTVTRKFHFHSPNRVNGYALRFRLPSLGADGNWIEGLDADHGSELLGLFAVSGKSSKSLNFARGCLLGALIGDSVGSYLEMLRRAPTEDELDVALTMPGGGVWGVASGQVTDDGELTLALGHALVETECTEYPAAKVAANYVRWAKSDPFDMGITTSNALDNVSPETTGLVDRVMLNAQRYNLESKANGSLMRASALGIWSVRVTLDQAIGAARMDALLTHPNLSCQWACAAYVVAIRELMLHPGNGAAAFDAACSVVNVALDSGAQEVKAWLEAAAAGRLPAFFPQAGFAKVAFIHAFWHLRMATPYVESLRAVMASGGDTDTNACIVGGLMGALHGFGALPREMVDAVLNCDTENGQPRPAWLSTKCALALADALAT